MRLLISKKNAAVGIRTMITSIVTVTLMWISLGPTMTTTIILAYTLLVLGTVLGINIGGYLWDDREEK